MTEPRRQHGTWMIVIGILAVAIVVAAAIGVGVLSGGQPSATEAASGAVEAGAETGALGSSDESDEGSVPPDAATINGTDTAMENEEIAQFVPNEVLVSVDDPAVLDTLVPGAKVGDGTIVSVDPVSQGSDGSSVVKITYEGDASEDDVIDALNEMGGVSAQKNFIYHLM